MTRANSLDHLFTVIFLTLFACITIQSMDQTTAAVNCHYYFRTADNTVILATPLDQAVFYNRVYVLKRLLTMNADPNHINKLTGLAQLTTAISQGSTNAAYELLNARADPNAVDVRGGSPLIAAAEKGFAALVNGLLFLKANIDQKSYPLYRRVTALMQAAQNGNIAVVKLLITAKATLNTPDIVGYTALHKAVLNRQNGVVRSLLAAGANPYKRDIYGKRPIDYATSDAIRTSLQNFRPCPATNAFDNSPANDAITHNMQQPLQETDSGLHTDIEKLNKYLIVAAQKDSADELPSFLSQGADVNAIFTQQMGTKIEQTTAACQAVQYNNLQGLQFLLKSGANPNLAKPNSGITPLFVAAFEGNAQAAILLLNANADPNTANVDDVTPLMVASTLGHKNVVKKLLFAKADANASATKTFGITALGQAAQHGLNLILTTLIKNEADVNQARIDGTSPLHNAVRNGHEETAHLLLRAGAHNDALDDEGKSPADYAKTAEMKTLLAGGQELAMQKTVKGKRKRYKKIKSVHENQNTNNQIDEG